MFSVATPTKTIVPPFFTTAKAVDTAEALPEQSITQSKFSWAKDTRQFSSLFGALL